MKKLKLLALMMALLLSQTGWARDWEHAQKMDEYFEILSADKTDFEPMGTICERVAFLEVESLYPALQYDIKTGLQYDEKGATIGELDLIIFDKTSKMVEAIAEVKCWKNMDGGLKKAREQRARFKTYLTHPIVIYDEANKTYSKDLFKNVKRFFTIAQFGGLEHGFDMELGLDLKEMMELRNRLLNCKVEGHCPRSGTGLK